MLLLLQQVFVGGSYQSFRRYRQPMLLRMNEKNMCFVRVNTQTLIPPKEHKIQSVQSKPSYPTFSHPFSRTL